MAKTRKYLLGMYEKSMPMDLTWEEKLNACKKAGFDSVFDIFQLAFTILVALFLFVCQFFDVV